jgi:hypothetical protein
MWRWLALGVLLTLASACDSEGEVAYTPSWLPVEFTLNTRGEIGISRSAQFVTRVGTFRIEVAAKTPLAGSDRETLLAIDHYVDSEVVQTRYRLSAQTQQIKVCGSGQVEIRVDPKNHSVRVSGTDLTTRVTVVAEAAACPSSTAPDYMLVVEHSNKCLDLPSANPADHVVLQQFTCHGAANQRWRIVHIGDGYYTIQSVASNKCLDVAWASTAEGEAVQQFPCHNRLNQQWRIGSGGIVARHSQKCLDIRGGGTEDHAVAQQFTCHGGPNQRWSLSS